MQNRFQKVGKSLVQGYLKNMQLTISEKQYPSSPQNKLQIKLFVNLVYN